MSLFLSDAERDAFAAFRKANAIGHDLYWTLRNRVEDRAASPGLFGTGPESHWWYCAAEYVTDAAMLWAVTPEERIGVWLRDVVLSLARRPVSDWVGPAFRSHAGKAPVGHLETAHLTWCVAVALDLAPDAFSASAREEAEDVLRNRGLPMCRRWLDKHTHLANWRCVLNAGFAAAAAVLDDADGMAQAAEEYRLCLNAFQPDGSYGESLQYANYAAYTLMIAYEALTRRNPALAQDLSLEPIVHMPRWQAASFFYRKPLSGWGAQPIARAANFNDSAAVFRPSGDLLLHWAARGKTEHPAEAGLARWLFDTLYVPPLVRPTYDGATFGFKNDFGFLSVPLLPAAAEPVPPESAGLPVTAAFSNGDVLARDAWNGKTVLAVHGGGEPLCGPGHLHGDLNSFILVHNRERLLADPGHSCYRNLIHGLEGSSLTHNTCTFERAPADTLGLQEDQHLAPVLEQSRMLRRSFDRETRCPEPPVDRGARRLLAERQGGVTVIGSDAAALYGPEIETFSRFWFLCGAHALFVVDRIVCRSPMRTRWHWLLNNRDDGLELKVVPPDRLVARRGAAGMKLFHLGGGVCRGVQHAYVHDAYSPVPAEGIEGRPGSGELITWREAQPARERTVVHAFAMDGYGSVAGWHLKGEPDAPVLESPGGVYRWGLEVNADASRMRLSEQQSGLTLNVHGSGGAWEARVD